MAEDDQESFSDSDSGSEEIEASPNNSYGGKKIGKISDYEKLRMKTIEENRKRMEALGIKKMANSFASSVPKQVKKRGDKKGKAKVVDEEEEYKPSDEEKDSDSSEKDESFDSDADFMDSSIKRDKKTAKNTVKTSKKQKSSQKPKRDSKVYVDDDEALMQAIALSLKDNAGFIDAKKSASQSSTAQADSPAKNERNRNSQTPEDSEKRKRKKVTGSRVQMKEDELIMYFYTLDEMGKGSITLRDLQRVAAAHDFTWSDKEMADMIRYFDTDGDGKLNLDDFEKIADRCNMMIQ